MKAHLILYTSNTTYTDDLHFAWILCTGRDVERAYYALKRILQGLLNQGLKVSVDKTTVVLEITGPGAAQCTLGMTLLGAPRLKP